MLWEMRVNEPFRACDEGRVLGDRHLLILYCPVHINVPPHFRSKSARGAILRHLRIACVSWAWTGGGGGLQTSPEKLLFQHQFRARQ